MQCGGIWGTRLDAHVSLGARLGGAVLVVSPRGMRRRGSVNLAIVAISTEKVAVRPPPGNHTVVSQGLGYIVLCSIAVVRPWFCRYVYV